MFFHLLVVHKSTLSISCYSLRKKINQLS
jgi:hypothetical protein